MYVPVYVHLYVSTCVSVCICTLKHFFNTSYVHYLVTKAEKSLKFPTVCEGSILSTQNLLDSLPDHSLPDIFTSIIQSSQEEKLQVLDAKDLNEVIRLALPLLLRQIEVSTV